MQNQEVLPQKSRHAGHALTWKQDINGVFSVRSVDQYLMAAMEKRNGIMFFSSTRADIFFLYILF